ncbi:MAG: AraC family transcriptional regulator [Ardenticatenaceae bacterium]|nr:MAG: AraC family transcriptional regulator [Ardenticatenaceae bacterium]
MVNGIAGTHPPNVGLQLTLNFGAQVVIAGHAISPLTAVISSPTERYDRVQAFGHVDLLNVAFRPAGARPFLHLPLNHLNNGSHDIRDFWPRLSVEALVDLAGLPPMKRKRGVETLLLAQMKLRFAPSVQVQHAMSLAVEQAGQITVQQLSDNVSLSRSQLFRVFKAQVGISPKTYLRVYRVKHAVNILQQAGKTRSLTTIAHEAGYFDQSHLIREFVLSTGLAPSQFLQREKNATFIQYILEKDK